MEPPSAAVVVTVVDETADDGDADPSRWSGLVGAVLEAEGVVGPAEANVLFVDRDAMAALNEEHMGVAGPTDVLSFPIDDEPEAELTGGVRFVGDLVVCPAVAAANAPTHAGSLDDEIALLLVHGTLHLLGHDHAEPDERSRMWAAERQLLAAHWGPLAADPWAAVADELEAPSAEGVAP